MVSRHRQEEAQAGRLWKLAERLCWRACSPVAIVVCGSAASGKSTLSADRSGLPVVFSDTVRQRHAGLEAIERARPEHYTEDFTKATYELLTRSALSRLDRKGAVIVDATCHTKSEHAQLFESLHRSGATFLVICCQVTLQTALERASARMQSPGRISDATPQIVAEQFARFEALSEIPAASALVLDTEQDLDAQVAELAIAVDTRMLAVRALSARTGAVYPVVERQAEP
jgi:predicted kinase